jgi:hypothetical protein
MIDIVYSVCPYHRRKPKNQSRIDNKQITGKAEHNLLPLSQARAYLPRKQDKRIQQL